MTEFLKLLAVYYMCDTAATERHLTSSEVVMCAQTYEQVKSWFADPGPAPVGLADAARANRQAYLRFKAWEKENADLVATLR